MEKVRRVIFSVRLLTFYMRDFVPIRMVIYGKVKFVFSRNYFQEWNATGIVDSLAQIVAFQQSTVIVCSVVF
jgi:hypothetical protein